MSGGTQDPFLSPEHLGDTARQTPGDLPARLGARLIDNLPFTLVGYPLDAAFDLGHLFPLIQVVAVYTYFVLLDTYWGTTLGKRLFGLRVIGPEGDRPGIKQAAIREAFMLVGYIPFVVTIIPFETATTVGQVLTVIVWIAIAVTINKSPTRQGKHDHLAGGTHVIKI